MKITHFTPQKIVWKVLESHDEFFKDKSEWGGTEMVFEITEKSGKAEIKFTHLGLVPQFECYTVCSNFWDFFITTSLKSLIETGKGKERSNEDSSFTTSIMIDESPKKVFEAINNVRGWWSEEIEGKTDELNAEFFYHYKDVHLAKMVITELIPNEKVVWFVKDNYFNFIEDKTEWKGTEIVFEVVKKDDKTQLLFIHHGLVQEYECYAICKDAWTSYIQGSLKNLITTGKGMPNTKEEGLNSELTEKWKLPEK
jgi:hypothetical protein